MKKIKPESLSRSPPPHLVGPTGHSAGSGVPCAVEWRSPAGQRTPRATHDRPGELRESEDRWWSGCWQNIWGFGCNILGFVYILVNHLEGFGSPSCSSTNVSNLFNALLLWPFCWPTLRMECRPPETYIIWQNTGQENELVWSGTLNVWGLWSVKLKLDGLRNIGTKLWTENISKHNFIVSNHILQ